ncbi:hypothetical protein GCM10012275_03740 [Longimycelium tulufanense]|uniref:Uncharacterized protein n=1 Tax=Longimycelium tulufanense TaxID=907463 RepID=A0A8J3FSA1_9PSEU|nr:hypothetical protein GCM10012275_03740 [Longimycelium tulufanense]
MSYPTTARAGLLPPASRREVRAAPAIPDTTRGVVSRPSSPDLTFRRLGGPRPSVGTGGALPCGQPVFRSPAGSDRVRLRRATATRELCREEVR